MNHIFRAVLLRAGLLWGMSVASGSHLFFYPLKFDSSGLAVGWMCSQNDSPCWMYYGRIQTNASVLTGYFCAPVPLFHCRAVRAARQVPHFAFLYFVLFFVRIPFVTPVHLS